ncbi:hypothetical protein ScalyP_jg11185 [Parmales sp. scaly parma]|nr:hypothetical protein ScalyP_jg11185 [Parmales sp. scaly parma]
MAAALTHKGVHHTWQGCPSSGGWSHAVSSDFVHWEDLGIDVKTLNETYAGMESVESPCSGFVALNDEGVPCAGFRQCASTHGITDHNPDAQDWDVPLEIRCATNADLTTWSEPKYIFDQYYYRGLPYDPARPWKDTDDKWYMAMSVDGCNSTTKAVPCAAGGQLDLWTADNFEGPWRQLDTPLFTTNKPKKGYDDAIPSFTSKNENEMEQGLFGVDVACSEDGRCARIFANCTNWVGEQPTCEVGVDATQLDVQGKSISGPLTFLGETVDGKKLELNMHAIVDGEVIEVIFNNRTAMVHYAQVIDEKSVSVELFGNVGGKLESWELETI